MLSTWRACAGALLGAFFTRAEVPQAQKLTVPSLDDEEVGYALGGLNGCQVLMV